MARRLTTVRCFPISGDRTRRSMASVSIRRESGTIVEKTLSFRRTIPAYRSQCCCRATATEYSGTIHRAADSIIVISARYISVPKWPTLSIITSCTARSSTRSLASIVNSPAQYLCSGSGRMGSGNAKTVTKPSRNCLR